MTRDELEAKVEQQARQIEAQESQIQQLMDICEGQLAREMRTLKLFNDLAIQVSELRNGETRDDLDDADWWKE